MIGFLVAVAIAPASAVAGTINVNWAGDELGGDASHCSPREAVMAANEVVSDPAGDGSYDGCSGGDVSTAVLDVVNVPAGLGPYVFTNHGPDDGNFAGDIDITRPVRIIGTGGGLATLDANSDVAAVTGQEDRVLDIHAGIPELPGFVAEVELVNLKITSGDAKGGCGGGGIVANSDIAIGDSVITGNRAPSGGACTTPNGGGIAAGGGVRLDTNRVAVTHNHADGSGGGIFVVDTVQPLNTTIAANTALGDGGGIAASAPSGQTASIFPIAATISGNSAGSKGGGFFLKEDGGSNGVGGLFGSLIAGNSAPIGPDCSSLGIGAISSNSPSLIGNTSGCPYSGPGPVNVSAGTGVLGNYGGLSDTIPLLEGSPAIDRYNCGTGTSDQRGVPRPVGPLCDLGAFEGFILNPPVPAAPAAPGPTGQRAAALKRCAKIKNKKKKKKCKKRARRLPV